MSRPIYTASSDTPGRSANRRSEGQGAPGRLRRLLADSRLDVRDRARRFAEHLARQRLRGLIVAREIAGPTGREVLVRDAATGRPRRMLMFGSNNYLGLANDPEVAERIRHTLRRWGAGVAGPPLLNGTTSLHTDLEGRVARLKGAEAAMLFSSGYAANLGWSAGLVGRRDLALLDERSHASAVEGLGGRRARVVRFRHNDVEALGAALSAAAARGEFANVFVFVEGVYSMDGDLAPLDRIVPLCRRHNAFLVVDDAHGTGVLGPTGRGAIEHFGLDGEIDLVVVTFSKALAVAGGALAGAREIIDYLRFFSPPYTLSAALPLTTVAAVQAGLDVIRRQPQRLQRLRENVRRLVRRLRSAGIDCESPSAIVAVRPPSDAAARRLAGRLHEAGIFVNAVEYPAVPAGQGRLRISVSSEHTPSDIDRLAEVLAEAWRREGRRAEADP